MNTTYVLFTAFILIFIGINLVANRMLGEFLSNIFFVDDNISKLLTRITGALLLVNSLILILGYFYIFYVLSAFIGLIILFIIIKSFFNTIKVRTQKSKELEVKRNTDIAVKKNDINEMVREINQKISASKRK